MRWKSLVLIAATTVLGCWACVVQEQGPDAEVSDAQPSADAEFAPDDGQALATCFRGSNFADCGGEGEPAVWCRSQPLADAGQNCLWFTHGRPAATFDQRSDCSTPYGDWDSPPACQGVDPWTRERAMNVAVAAVPGVGGAPDSRCRCEGCAEPMEAVCDPSMQYGFTANQWPTAEQGVSFPSMVEVYVFPDFGEDGPERFLQLSIDFFWPEGARASACIVYTPSLHSRADSVPPPICADRGTLRVAARPTDSAAVEGLHGTAELEFDRVDFNGDGRLVFDDVRLSVDF